VEVLGWNMSPFSYIQAVEIIKIVDIIDIDATGDRSNNILPSISSPINLLNRTVLPSHKLYHVEWGVFKMIALIPFKH